jgi:hypothetical protein
VKWSVVVKADGDRVLRPDEVVELADAVARFDGVASGIGTTTYAAQLLVEADDRNRAIELATEQFSQAAATAGLPAWPISAVGIEGEDDQLDYLQ